MCTTIVCASESNRKCAPSARTMPIRGSISLGFVFLATPMLVAAQSAVPSPASAVDPEPAKLVERVIANQKRDEAALELYERIERQETRKNANDASPAVVKIARVIPSGTGMDKIPVGTDGKPPDPAAYRARLQALEQALALIAGNNRSQRDVVEKYAKKRKDRGDLIEATRNAFLFTFVRRVPRGNRVLAKYEMSPNPAFRPTSRL